MTSEPAFDFGQKITVEHNFQDLLNYSKKIWPDKIPHFEKSIMEFYNLCSQISISILKQIEISLNYSTNYFADKFNLPMALLRCNYYPKRSKELTDNDYGIAPVRNSNGLSVLNVQAAAGILTCTITTPVLL